MASSSIARRYARALSALGLEDGQIEAYGDELQRVVQANAASDELRDFWSNPVHSRQNRLAAVDALASELKLSAPVINLLRLLVERGRMAELEMINREYAVLVDEHVGRVRAVITSATALPESLTDELSSVLQKATGRQIVLETRVDPSLIGGVVAQVGSTVLDGSIRAQLASMKDELERAPLLQGAAG